MAKQILALLTEGLLANEKLPTLLRSATTLGVVDRDIRQAGNLRSAGTERGL